MADDILKRLRSGSANWSDGFDIMKKAAEEIEHLRQLPASMAEDEQERQGVAARYRHALASVETLRRNTDAERRIFLDRISELHGALREIENLYQRWSEDASRDATAANIVYSMKDIARRAVPSLPEPVEGRTKKRPEPCTDPDKMHGACDGFPGSDFDANLF